MPDHPLRNVWLISRREYLERVRTRSFVIFTALIPLLMFAVSVVPTRLAMMKSSETRTIVAVVPDAEFGRMLEEQMKVVGDRAGGSGFQVRVNLAASDAERQALDRQVTAKQIDGYLWVTPEAIRERKIQYVSRASSDFIGIGTLAAALRLAIMKQRLAAHGTAGEELNELVRPLELETIDVTHGKTSGQTVFLTAFLLMMTLYSTVLMYGVSVLRSILEEKHSRVAEVMLASVTAKEMMAGKILGVGAVGLTQIFIWAAVGAVASGPTLAALVGSKSGIQIPASAAAYFAVFFLLGYLLYSAMCAALGAMVNSEQEAQQMQFPIVLPMLLSLVMIPYIMRQPDSLVSVIVSMIPFCAPLVMYLRILMQPPPVWQIALCLALMVATIYGMLALSARIYRVGILMYGKRPTLPEILKWVRYA